MTLVDWVNLELSFLDGTEIIEEYPVVLAHPENYMKGLSSYIISEDTNEYAIDIYHNIISALALYICANNPKPAFVYRYILLLSDILQLHIHSEHMLRSIKENQKTIYKYAMSGYIMEDDNPGGFYYPDIDKKKFEKLICSNFDERFNIENFVDSELLKSLLNSID